MTCKKNRQLLFLCSGMQTAEEDVENETTQETDRRDHMESDDVAAEEPEPDDVAAKEEEKFETGNRLNALAFAENDRNADLMLDFEEFVALVKQRETVEGGHTIEELRERFDSLNVSGSGKIHLHEYIRWSLRDALSRSATRVMDLFRVWDEDGSGLIDKVEFRRAIRALGFDFFMHSNEIDLVFDDFDRDHSGELDYKELNKMLRQGQAIKLEEPLQDGAVSFDVEAKNRHKLRRQRSHATGRSFSSSVVLKPSGEMSVMDQLRELLATNMVRIIDLFREWDENGDGLVSKKEFRKAIAALGYEAPRVEVDALFEPFDVDGSGMIEYGELKSLLHRTDVKIDKALQPGAAGEIELSTNLHGGSSQRSLQGTGSPSRSKQSGSPTRKPPPSIPSPPARLARQASMPSGGAKPPNQRRGPLNGRSSLKELQSARPTDQEAGADANSQTDAEAEAAARAGKAWVSPERAAFEKQLRCRLDGVLVGGGDDGEQLLSIDALALSPPRAPPGGSIGRAAPPVDEEVKRQHKTAHGQARIKAAVTIQARARGCYARGAGRRARRVWTFAQSLMRVMSITGSDASGDEAALEGHGGHEGNRTSTIYVHRHEKLELLSATGSGRLLLDATDQSGNLVVCRSCLYDTSLHAINTLWSAKGAQLASPATAATARGLGASAASSALCSLPGEFQYRFAIEGLPGQSSAHLQLRLRREARYTEADLISEPPPEPSRSMSRSMSRSVPPPSLSCLPRGTVSLESSPRPYYLKRAPAPVAVDSPDVGSPRMTNHLSALQSRAAATEMRVVRQPSISAASLQGIPRPQPPPGVPQPSPSPPPIPALLTPSPSAYHGGWHAYDPASPSAYSYQPTGMPFPYGPWGGGTGAAASPTAQYSPSLYYYQAGAFSPGMQQWAGANQSAWPAAAAAGSSPSKVSPSPRIPPGNMTSPRNKRVAAEAKRKGEL